MSLESAATKLSDAISRRNAQSLEQVLEVVAVDIGVRHISHLRFVSHSDVRLLDAIVTYSVQWQQRYYEKQYASIDPVLAWGSRAVLPFDWEELAKDESAIVDFFADARNYGVGRNGISFPIRNRTGLFSLVSFTSNHSRGDWAEYKKNNISNLQKLSGLIDSAASISRQSKQLSVNLSAIEEQCVILAAKGKNYNHVAEVLDISSTEVQLYLDTARHKLNCVNVPQAIAVAIATGAIPAAAVNGG